MELSPDQEKFVRENYINLGQLGMDAIMGVNENEFNAYRTPNAQDIEDALLHSEAASEGTCNCCHGAECPTHPDEPTPASLASVAMHVAIDFKTAKALISDVLESYNESGSSLAAVEFAFELADHFGFTQELEALALAQERLN